jgi:hypothetical protein
MSRDLQVLFAAVTHNGVNINADNIISYNSLRSFLFWNLFVAGAACGDVFIFRTGETQWVQFMVLKWRNWILSFLFPSHFAASPSRLRAFIT